MHSDYNGLDCIKPSNSVVHKHLDEDVLIYNCREALPVFFLASELDISVLAPADIDAINTCYQEIKDSSANIHVYCLKNIPWKVDCGNNQCDMLLAQSPSWLDEYYVKSGDSYQLQEMFMPEYIQESIQSFYGVFPSEYEKFLAAQALDKLAVERKKVFHCSVYNDTKHYYFYAKRHEHVPGIMTMEIARQAFYAHFYHFYDFKKENINLSILEFNCQFSNYLQSNYPINITVETLSLTGENSARGNIELRATVYQQRKKCSVIDISSSIVKTKLFNKLRDTKPAADEIFHVLPDRGRTHVLIRANSGETALTGVLDSLSHKTLYVRLENNEAHENLAGSCCVDLVTQHQGVISGEGEMLVTSHKDGLLLINVVEMPRKSSAKLREFIKMDCYLSDAFDSSLNNEQAAQSSPTQLTNTIKEAV